VLQAVFVRYTPDFGPDVRVKIIVVVRWAMHQRALPRALAALARVAAIPRRLGVAISALSRSKNIVVSVWMAVINIVVVVWMAVIRAKIIVVVAVVLMCLALAAGILGVEGPRGNVVCRVPVGVIAAVLEQGHRRVVVTRAAHAALIMLGAPAAAGLVVARSLGSLARAQREHLFLGAHGTWPGIGARTVGRFDVQGARHKVFLANAEGTRWHAAFMAALAASLHALRRAKHHRALPRALAARARVAAIPRRLGVAISALSRSKNIVEETIGESVSVKKAAVDNIGDTVWFWA
jgi:hypothetical protein